MSNWWAQKLAPQQPAGIVLTPVQPQPQPQPVQYRQAPAPAYPQQQAAPAPQQVDHDPNRKLSLREAVARFSGGESARVEGNLACPSCGSATGYTQFSGMGGMAAGVLGNRPAPHCFECGYNGKFAQGMEANWVS